MRTMPPMRLSRLEPLACSIEAADEEERGLHDDVVDIENTTAATPATVKNPRPMTM